MDFSSEHTGLVSAGTAKSNRKLKVAQQQQLPLHFTKKDGSIPVLENHKVMLADKCFPLAAHRKDSGQRAG